MTLQTQRLVLFVIAFASFSLGGLSGRYYPQIKEFLTTQTNRASEPRWSAGFSVVQIRASVDGTLQPSYFIPAPPGTARPLLVSLHSWNGTYAQHDPLAAVARSNGWTYIHPDFRGPNRTKDACLSPKVLSDIDDAIQYAIDTGSVDSGNMYVVGVSGGGHAALGAYLRSRHRLRAVLAWVPVSDLIAYFHESRSRNTQYAEDILRCTSDGTTLDENEARRRSPIYWDFPATPRGRLELYAGINDGYKGNVPISHSILFFNRVAEQYGYPESQVHPADMVKLLTRGIERSRSEPRKVIGNYGVLFFKSTPVVSLTIFDGGHDWSAEESFDRIKEMAGSSSTSRMLKTRGR